MIIDEIPEATHIWYSWSNKYNNCDTENCGEIKCKECGIEFTHEYYDMAIVQPSDRLREIKKLGDWRRKPKPDGGQVHG